MFGFGNQIRVDDQYAGSCRKTVPLPFRRDEFGRISLCGFAFPGFQKSSFLQPQRVKDFVVPENVAAWPTLFRNDRIR